MDDHRIFVQPRQSTVQFSHHHHATDPGEWRSGRMLLQYLSYTWELSSYGNVFAFDGFRRLYRLLMAPIQGGSPLSEKPKFTARKSEIRRVSTLTVRSGFFLAINPLGVGENPSPSLSFDLEQMKALRCRISFHTFPATFRVRCTWCGNPRPPTCSRIRP